MGEPLAGIAMSCGHSLSEDLPSEEMPHICERMVCLPDMVFDLSEFEDLEEAFEGGVHEDSYSGRALGRGPDGEGREGDSSRGSLAAGALVIIDNNPIRRLNPVEPT